MKHAAPLEVAQAAIRSRVCPHCYQRPAGSEALGPTVPRACEGECTIFTNLPTLLRIAQGIHEPTISRYDRAIAGLICKRCDASPTAGDYCSERTIRECPLSRYSGDVVDVLERLPH